MQALTIHIGIFGRTNVGKSSLLNFITNQDTSIVSGIHGTTTDVVQKQVQLNPIGPTTMFDTAGINDKSSLSKARIEKTKKIFNMCDIILLMCESEQFNNFEQTIVKEAKERSTPLIIIIGKTDLQKPSNNFLEKLRMYSSNILQFSNIDSNRDDFLSNFKIAILEVLPEDHLKNHSVLKTIVKKGDIIVLVIPIDLGTPIGKLIMPQVQTLRHILDLNACGYIVQNNEYEDALKNLKKPPALVITDSQVVGEIERKTHKNIKLTTFSIINAANKSDIVQMAKGAARIASLKDGDKVLIAEACTHHASKDDIGTIKIPKSLKEYTQKKLITKHTVGQDYPQDLLDYKLVIHCGACTLNRKTMLSRFNKIILSDIAITNYGMAISVFKGVIEKVLEIFPEALSAYKNELKSI